MLKYKERYTIYKYTESIQYKEESNGNIRTEKATE